MEEKINKDLRVDEVNRHTIAIFILVSKEIKQLLSIKPLDKLSTDEYGEYISLVRIKENCISTFANNNSHIGFIKASITLNNYYQSYLESGEI